MHARVGGETLDGTVTQNIAAGATIKLTKNNFSGNLLVFRKNDLLVVPSMGGYKPGSQTDHNGEFLTLDTDLNGAKHAAAPLCGPYAQAPEGNIDLD